MFSRLTSVVLLVIGTSLPAFSQSVDIKDVKTDSEETTISIKKGGAVAQAGKCQPAFEILSSNEELVGDGANMNKPARANWKKSCDEWKKEMKAMNKGNQILALSCGNPSCGPEGTETVCKSSASYKMKVKLSE